MSGNNPCADLSEIADAIERIADRTSGLDRAAVLANDVLRDAVAMQLLVLGEAARRLPETVRVSAPDVPWAQIIATRNRIAHGYSGLNWIIVWDIATLELPKLAPHFDALLAKWSAP
jgi:uncharacterized protein with HEPN domain